MNVPQIIFVLAVLGSIAVVALAPLIAKLVVAAFWVLIVGLLVWVGPSAMQEYFSEQDGRD